MNKKIRLISELQDSIIGVEFIKEAEYKLQDTIERLYPGKFWWQTTNVKIYEELAFNRLPAIEVIWKIAHDIEPEMEGVNINEG